MCEKGKVARLTAEVFWISDTVMSAKALLYDNFRKAPKIAWVDFCECASREKLAEIA